MSHRIRGSPLLATTHQSYRDSPSHLCGNVFYYLVCNFTRKRILALLVIMVLIILTALVPLYIFSSLNEAGDNSTNLVNKLNHIPIYQRAMHNSSLLLDLKQRIRDLEKIKVSIANELRYLEKEKLKLNQDKINLQVDNSRLASKTISLQNNLKQLELDLSSSLLTKYDNIKCDILPALYLPMKPTFNHINSAATQSIEYDRDSTQSDLNLSRNFRDCFNFSRCPLINGFKVYFYNSSQFLDSSSGVTINRKVGRNSSDMSMIELDNFTNLRRLRTHDPSKACLYVYIMDGRNAETLSDLYASSAWNDGRNHLIIDLTNSKETTKGDTCAMFAQSTFYINSFRPNLDMVIPSTWVDLTKYESIKSALPRQCPARRTYLASYFGLNERKEFITDSSSMNAVNSIIATEMIQYAFAEKTQLDELEEILKLMRMDSTSDSFLFKFECGPRTNEQCFMEKDKMMGSSTFLIILPPVPYNLIATNYQSHLLYLSLSRSTIPIIIGSEYIKLPFDEVIDWCKAAICLPTARLPELHFILKTIPDSDLIRLKQQGRHIFERYMATSEQLLETILNIISFSRLKFPPLPVEEIETRRYTISQLKDSALSNTSIFSEQDRDQSQEILGPFEISQPSLKFYRNLSLTLSQSYNLWNDRRFFVNQLFPSTPFDPILPSDAKFMKSNYGFRPIANGAGGSGSEFSRSLGGDWPSEQFTIVLLTYEREPIMLKTLLRFKRLPYLNSVLVVWNSERHKPSPNLTWPDIGVPIKVVKTDRNSLNNRFLPYDEIETDAILSIDDDSPLKQDEIIFGFRVWRESRDRIVGFPGRYHAWDAHSSTWQYNSNHSCELSMVLTGGAFYHKYYSYLYTYSMASAIRALVDKYTNCEDIAMNFLVSHITRKPPIKVTSRWTFHCPGCPVSLSEDDSHFRERHDCMNTFTSIYGYMPLMSTQHRADSILFKTRIPHDKQKCFKNV